MVLGLFLCGVGIVMVLGGAGTVYLKRKWIAPRLAVAKVVVGHHLQAERAPPGPRRSLRRMSEMNTTDGGASSAAPRFPPSVPPQPPCMATSGGA
jgi:hypothetical protein